MRTPHLLDKSCCWCCSKGSFNATSQVDCITHNNMPDCISHKNHARLYCITHTNMPDCISHKNYAWFLLYNTQQYAWLFITQKLCPIVLFITRKLCLIVFHIKICLIVQHTKYAWFHFLFNFLSFFFYLECGIMKHPFLLWGKGNNETSFFCYQERGSYSCLLLFLHYVFLKY